MTKAELLPIERQRELLAQSEVARAEAARLAVEATGTLVLTLSTDVALTLLDITRYIGGHDKTSRRRHADEIRNALLPLLGHTYRTPRDVERATCGIFFISGIER